MMMRRRILAVGLLMFVASFGVAHAQSAGELDAAADATLQRLVTSEPVTEQMVASAAGILIFPEIVKGGLVVGAAAGDGVLRAGGGTEGYYRSVAVSYGLQAGITKFGYVMFFMDQDSLAFVRDTAGWEIGVGPNVTVADKGIAKRLSTSTVQDGIYVFFVDQEGFFAGAGVEGTKISKIAE